MLAWPVSLAVLQRRLRQEVFLREVIPWWLAPVGYGGLAILSIIFIPMVYTPVKWYFVAVAYLVTPLFALPNSYGAGLTDWDCASMYGKLALFVFAAWAGAEVRRRTQEVCSSLFLGVFAAWDLRACDSIPACLAGV